MNYNFDYSMPEHFIYRHCQRLHINKKYVEQAIKITKNIQRLKIATEHTPLSVASGTVFLITKLNELSVTKKKIAREFEVSEVTITKVLEKLELYQDIILSNKLTNIVMQKIKKSKKSKQKRRKKGKKGKKKIE